MPVRAVLGDFLMTISSRLRGGLSLALATTLSLGAFAGATAANAADEPAMPVETRAAAPFVAELTTEIMIGDGVGPGAMEFSHDGRYAYVVGVANGTLNVVDLKQKSSFGPSRSGLNMQTAWC